VFNVEKTELEGVLLIKPDIFKDKRGLFVSLYDTQDFKEKVTSVRFVQDGISISKKNVLRGIHGDLITWKLVTCLKGKLHVVLVNCNPKKEDFGKWQAFSLSGRNKHQVLVPPDYGNSYLSQAENSICYYKQSTLYVPDRQFSYKWNDPKFNIDWPVKEPILSGRDE